MVCKNAFRSIGLVWLVAALAGLLYLTSLAPGVLWQDSAMLQVRVCQSDLTGRLGLAVSHPLYIILAKSFAWIIPGNFAWRVNLFSAVCSAGAIGFLFAGLSRLTRRTWPALIAVILLAVSHTFWTHAVIAEVYGLYALLLSVEMYLLVRYQQQEGPRGGWCLIGLFLVNGLNASNHLLALLHLPAYAIYVFLQLRAKRIRIAQVLLMLLALVIGAGLYEAMIIVQIARGAGVADTIRSALFGLNWQDHVLGSTPDGLGLAKCLGYFLLNFPTPLLLLVPLGIYFGLRDSQTRSVAAVWFGVCAVAFVFAIRYHVPDQYVFFFPCYIFTAVFIGLAGGRIGEWLASMASTGGRIAVLILALLPALAYELAPSMARKVPLLSRMSDKVLRTERAIPGRDIYTYFLRPRKNGDQSARDFARDALELAQPDGLIIADNTTRNPIIYLQQVDHYYPGVYLAKASDLKAGREVEPDLATVERWLASGRRVFIVSPQRQSHLAEEFEVAGRFSVALAEPLYEVRVRSSEHSYE